MPTYKYQCDGCGAERLEVMTFAEHDKFFAGEHWRSIECEKSVQDWLCGWWRQVYDFQFSRGMAEHFNHSLGTHVSTERAANDNLKRLADENSARHGYDHQYELVDPRDKDSVGVTDQGLEATEKRAVDEGRVQPKLYL